MNIFAKYSVTLLVASPINRSIFFTFFLDLFNQAWKLGMHGGDYAWILPGDTIDLSKRMANSLHSEQEECTPSQLSQTQNGLIIVESHGAALENEISSSGLVSTFYVSYRHTCQKSSILNWKTEQFSKILRLE